MTRQSSPRYKYGIFSLLSVDLGNVSPNFQVDMTALKQMGDNDLKEMGIPMVYSFPNVSTVYEPLSSLFSPLVFILSPVVNINFIASHMK